MPSLLLALSACSGPYDLKRLSCDSDVLDWRPDPARWLDQADDEGRFEVETGWSALPKVQGSYDGAHYSESRDWSFGQRDEYDLTLEWFPNGDLTFSGQLTQTTAQGYETSAEVELQRVGCAVERSSANQGGVATASEEWFEDHVEYVTTSEYADGGFEVIEGTADGEVDTFEGLYTSSYGAEWQVASTARWTEGEETNTQDYEDPDTGEAFHVRTDLHGDGSLEYHLDHRYGVTSETTQYALDPQGSGSGTFTTSDGLECTLTFVEWVCTSECNVSTVEAC